MNWNAAAQTLLSSRAGKKVRWLVWAQPKDYDTGAIVKFGYWTGMDHATFSISGESRLYYGAAGAMEIPTPMYQPGTDIHTSNAALAVTPEAESFFRGYNIRFAPIEIHCALYDAATDALLDVQRSFKGFIDEAELPKPALGGGGSMINLTLVSSARRGTITSRGKKSDQSQRKRIIPAGSVPDRFRKYASLGRRKDDPWGVEA